MNFSDETLMAYAKGELGEPGRSAVEAAERDDQALAASIARHRARRNKVFAAFSGAQAGPVPASLQPPATGADAGTATRPATITSLAAARERKAKARGAAGMAHPDRARRRAWPRWGALAAALAIGVLAGSVWMSGGEDGGFVATDSTGRLVARGELAGALTGTLTGTLTQQSAGTVQPDARVRIGVSFAARGGAYCRSFQAGVSTGLACRDGESWRIPVLREVPAGSAAGRQAGATVPAAVLEVIDERIEGMTLDAAAERAARERGWKR